MSSFTENLYLKLAIQKLQEENITLRSILNEYSGAPNYAAALREIGKTPQPVYPGENASPEQIKKWKKDTESWAMDQRKLAAAMERSTTRNTHPVADAFYDAEVAIRKTREVNKRREAAKKESYPGQHPVRPPKAPPSDGIRGDGGMGM